MRVVGMVALAAALAACQTQRPAQQAATVDETWERPGCPETLPRFIADIPYDGTGPRFIEFAPARCLGNGLVEGAAVTTTGMMYRLTMFLPDAPGAPSAVSGGAPSKPHVIAVKGR
jgi:hypothetical protein